MKRSRCFALLLAGCVSSPLLADPTLPQLTTAPVEKLFAPLGFDANDAVEVVAYGHFPSTCFKVGPTAVAIDHEARMVTVEVTAYTYAGLDCAQVLVPFTTVVSLGTLRPGGYQVVVKDRPVAGTTELAVAEATTSNPDDFLYAPVDQAALETMPDGTRLVRVEGTYPYTFVGCMVMKDVRIYRSTGNVLVVQPVAELTDGAPCEAQARSKSFSITTPFAEALGAGDYLLHVRALSGRSVNRVVEVEAL